MNLEKAIVRTGAACLATAALSLGSGCLLHVRALFLVAKYAAVAFVVVGTVPASVAIVLVLLTGKRRQ